MPHSTEQVRDQRIARIRPLTSPALLSHELPLGEARAGAVAAGRGAVSDIVDGVDDRLLVVVGPCSVHDPAAALDYGVRLREQADRYGAELCLVMRVYFEKPRTVTGWKGLINDPHLDDSGDVNEGLRTARRLLLDVLDLGLPTGCEFLDPIIPQYIADTVSWGAIGARTVESQVHRQLASGLSMPVGLKNRTDGGLQPAVDAVLAAAAPHVFTGITEHGTPAVLSTTGNPDCHLILRGGGGAPNYDAASVDGVLTRLRGAGLAPRVVIDASHDNCRKDNRRQPAVAEDVAAQVAAGQRGIVGVMLESFLVAGRQDPVAGRPLVYGQSITDACMGWDTTTGVLDVLAKGVVSRRAAR
jgi:3-deoxy-7-phosphoheptulonate synthase